MDGRDVDSIRRAVLDARPDIIVHELTALAGGMNLKTIDTSFAVTNELRTRATDALLAAGLQAGTSRFIVQSFTGWTNEHAGARVKSSWIHLTRSLPRHHATPSPRSPTPKR